MYNGTRRIPGFLLGCLIAMIISSATFAVYNNDVSGDAFIGLLSMLAGGILGAGAYHVSRNGQNGSKPS